jgi:hypothetical protein
VAKVASRIAPEFSAGIPVCVEYEIMSKNAFEDFRLFPSISEAWELVRSGLVIIREELYKVDLWHSYANPDIPYYVSISIQKDGTWTKMADPPFAVGRDGDQALRDAMAFLTERVAA